ncbi:MAG: glycosyltransferase [Planctomycetota bacterium]
MIFVTVGAQMPFDRLVRTVDAWAAIHPEHHVLAQIGEGATPPAAMHWTQKLDAATFRRCLFEADLVVTHAGMGTILTALELGKPTIVMPRRGQLRETRNDHQLATAESLLADERIAVAWDERELREKLEHMADVAPPPPVPSHASADLLDALRQFIRDGEVRPAVASTRDAGDEVAPARIDHFTPPPAAPTHAPWRLRPRWAA